MKKLLSALFLLLSVTAAQAYSPPTGTGLNVLNNGATLVGVHLGTPADGVATNLTGLPLTTGVTGILPVANGGTNSAYFGVLGPTVARNYTFPDQAATMLYSGGPGGTPSSITLTNATGTAASLTAGSATTATSATTAGTLTGALSANQLLGSLTAVAPTGLSIPDCNVAGSAIAWAAGVGFSCRSGFGVSGSTAFSTITGSTNTTAAMIVGTGASLAVSGSGTIAATTVSNGVYTTDTGTVTNNMLAGSIANGKLLSSSVTVAGHAVSLGASTTIACGDLSNGAASCSTDTTNGTNITTGTVAFARHPTSIQYATAAMVNTNTGGI